MMYVVVKYNSDIVTDAFNKWTRLRLASSFERRNPPIEWKKWDLHENFKFVFLMEWMLDKYNIKCDITWHATVNGTELKFSVDNEDDFIKLMMLDGLITCDL